MKIYDFGLTALIIGIVALGVASYAHYKMPGTTGQAVEKVAEEVADEEFGVPAGTILEDAEKIVDEIEGKK